MTFHHATHFLRGWNNLHTINNISHWQPLLQPDCATWVLHCINWTGRPLSGQWRGHDKRLKVTQRAHPHSRHINRACDQCIAPESQAQLEAALTYTCTAHAHVKLGLFVFFKVPLVPLIVEIFVRATYFTVPGSF